MTINDVPKYWKPAEIAALTGLTSKTVRRWIAAGELPAIRPSGSPRGPLLVPDEAVQKLLASGRSK